jgi:DNA-cytosine methyltransferase
MNKEDEGIVVVSCFDGMACAYLALKKAGVKVKKYFAYEIDKYAMKVAKDNFPDIIHVGDITKASVNDFEGLKVDLLCAGSPCQGFSFAGKQLAFDDPRSKLFFEFVRLKNEINPKYFFLENVKMKKEFEVIISQYIGIGPIEINSNLVSAQNRARLYWTNIGAEKDGLFGELKCMIPQPKDKGILLKDILEENVPDKYFLSDKMLNYFDSRASNFNNGKVNIRDENGKASCLLSSMASCDISDNFIKIDTNLKVSNDQAKANCFTAGGNSGGLHSDMTLIVASRGRNPENPNSRTAGLPTKQVLEPRYDGKTNCLTSVQKDNLVAYGCDFRSDEGFRIRTEEKSSTLMARARQDVYGTGLVATSKLIRRLTPVECERLQTVPDNYTQSVSDTQRYKMLGNGWTVDVITHIFYYMKIN